MVKRKIHITERDATRLREWLHWGGRRLKLDREYVEVLQRELERACLIQPEEIPPDVVTMRSQVRLVDVNTEQEMLCTLVFPEDALATDGSISVLAPVGAAILGCSVGDVVRFQTPRAVRTLRIVEVLYQPEAAGHYFL